MCGIAVKFVFTRRKWERSKIRGNCRIDQINDLIMIEIINFRVLIHFYLTSNKKNYTTSFLNSTEQFSQEIIVIMLWFLTASIHLLLPFSEYLAFFLKYPEIMTIQIEPPFVAEPHLQRHFLAVDRRLDHQHYIQMTT